jgi:hypothetical protein
MIVIHPMESTGASFHGIVVIEMISARWLQSALSMVLIRLPDPTLPSACYKDFSDLTDEHNNVTSVRTVHREKAN